LYGKIILKNMTQKQKEEYVAKIWTDPRHPAAFAGSDKLYDVIRKEGKYSIGRGTLRKLLSNKETHSLQKPARRNFLRNRVIVSGIDAQGTVIWLQWKMFQYTIME
jgi:hypothetical protein